MGSSSSVIASRTSSKNNSQPSSSSFASSSFKNKQDAIQHGELVSSSTSTKPRSLSSMIATRVEGMLNSAVKKQSNSLHQEYFMDSIYIKEWLSPSDANELYDYFAPIGEKHRPKDQVNASKVHSKYPLWTKYYGLRRLKDNALALDRWGSYHEAWLRVEEPPACLQKVASQLRKYFHPHDVEAVNSMVVNFYYDGDNTYIPAHRDTVACLQDHSRVICLSLGTSRDFILCTNEQLGEYQKSHLNIVKEYRVGHGDIFAIGMETNAKYLHVVPQEHGLQDMRISIVFRSIDKSFILKDDPLIPNKDVVFANGKIKSYQAECITTTSYDDIGQREHIADLMQTREDAKKLKEVMKTKPTTTSSSQNQGNHLPESIQTIPKISTIDAEANIIKQKEVDNITAMVEKLKEAIYIPNNSTTTSNALNLLQHEDQQVVPIVINKEQIRKVMKRGSFVPTFIASSAIERPETLLSDDESKHADGEVVMPVVIQTLPIEQLDQLSAYEKEFYAQNIQDDDQRLVYNEGSNNNGGDSAKMKFGGDRGGGNCAMRSQESFIFPSDTFFTAAPFSKKGVLSNQTDGMSSRGSSRGSTRSMSSGSKKHPKIQRTLDSYYLGFGVAVPTTR